ncbi:MAG: toxin-antitoxin system protein [Thermoanaerobaculia bacterium]
MKSASTTIRIPTEMHEELRGFAEEEHSTLTGVLVEALELYRRERFVARVNAGYSLLREETAAWKDHLAERDAWDTTLEDGLPKAAKKARSRKR